MKIKKLGHCCLVIDINGTRILTDPGSFSTGQDEEKNISAVLITHEHQDHLHIDSIKAILKNNPDVIIITNTAVGKILESEGIKYTKVENEESYNLNGIKINGFGTIHAEIYGDYGRVQNTGYTVNEFCIPGDAFEMPHEKVEILALPVAGPWMRVKDAIDYAKALKPRVVFPVHDAILAPVAAFVPKMLEHFLSESGIKTKAMELGKEEEV
jgi:L-ascorbate metabolism protein UlaG (beta-lactamase superfamily)